MFNAQVSSKDIDGAHLTWCKAAERFLYVLTHPDEGDAKLPTSKPARGKPLPAQSKPNSAEYSQLTGNARTSASNTLSVLLGRTRFLRNAARHIARDHDGISTPTLWELIRSKFGQHITDKHLEHVKQNVSARREGLN